MAKRTFPEKPILLTEDNTESAKREFEITEVISEGSSCICYEAKHRNSGKGVLKEYWPVDCDNLRRDSRGQVVLMYSTQEEIDAYEKRKREYFESYRRLLEAKHSDDNSDLATFIPNFEIYSGCDKHGRPMGTSYIWTPTRKLKTLDKIVDETHINPEENAEEKLGTVLTAIRELVKCVMALNQAGFVHRDIKPSNFGFVTRGNETLTQTLTMFDVDTVWPASEPTNVVVGTPGFMEPEAGREELDYRTDIYSIGATVFNAVVVTEETESDGFLYRDRYYDRLEEMVNSSRLITGAGEKIHPKFIEMLVEILRNCLCGKFDRYESFDELLEDLEGALFYILPPEQARKVRAGEKYVLIDDNTLVVQKDPKSIAKKLTDTKKKKIIIVAIATLIVVVLFLSGIFAGEISENELQISVSYEGISNVEAEENFDIIEERVNAFSEEEDIRSDFNVNDNGAVIVLPKDAVKTGFEETFTRKYLTRSTRLYAIDVDKEDEEFIIKNNGEGLFSSEVKSQAINREDIRSIELKEGNVLGEKAEAYGIKAKAYPYIKITLTDSAAFRLRDMGNFAIGLDVYQHSGDWFAYMPDFEDDGKTFYIVDNKESREYTYLLYHNLDNEPLSESATFQIDNDSFVRWENVRDNEVERGENQYNASKVSEKTLNVQVETFEKLDSGRLKDEEKKIKKRLDQIGCRYAIGKIPSKEKSIMVVKLPVESVGKPIIHLIFEQYLEIGNIYGTQPLYEWKSQVKDDKIVLKEKSFFDESITNASESAVKHGTRIVLYTGDYPVLSAECEKKITDNVAKFAYLGMSGKTIEGYEWISDIMNSPVPEEHWSVESIIFNCDRSGNYASEKDMLINNNDFESEITHAVKSIDRKATVRFKDDSLIGSSVIVLLNRKMNAKMVDDTVRFTSGLMRKIRLENTPYSNIMIVPCDENSYESEREEIARVRITISPDYETDSMGYSIGCYGAGEKYHDALCKGFSEDSVLSKLEDKE